ncbi:MAG: hypothetical protein R2865_09335 [Deinococcales bacterium]
MAASEVDRRLYEIDRVNNLYNSYLATTQQRNLAVTDTTPQPELNQIRQDLSNVIGFLRM